VPEGILGRKLGMTAIFGEEGRMIAVTVIDTKDNKVLGKRTDSQNGYTAVIIGVGEKKAKRANKPTLGFYEKNGLVDDKDGVAHIKREVREFRIDAETLSKYTVGELLAGDKLFKVGEIVDVIGVSKGKGFQGVVKKYHFKGSANSHGQHEYHRHGGSIGANTYPAHVFKGKKMPGQMGNARLTLQNVKIVQVMVEEGILLIRGGIPGPTGGFVRVQKAVKAKPQ